MFVKTVGYVENSINSDQMPHSVVSDLGLHSLLRPVCTRTLSYHYGLIYMLLDNISKYFSIKDK